MISSAYLAHNIFKYFQVIYFLMSRDDFISIDAIRFGLNGLQNNFRFFLVLMIIVTVLYNLPTLITTYFFKLQIQDGTSLQKLMILIPLALVSIIIYLTVDLGLLRIALKFRDNAAVGFMDLFREYKLLIKYLVATIIFYMMILLPFFIISTASTFPA
jgi:hypothetical protein